MELKKGFYENAVQLIFLGSGAMCMRCLNEAGGSRRREFYK